MDNVFNNFTGKGQRMLAHRIDEQLQQLICRQIASLFDKLSTGLGEHLKLEIDSAIEAIYYMFSLNVGKPTPGMQAVDLTVSKDQNNTLHKNLGIGYIFAKYGVQKLHSISNSNGWRDMGNGDIRNKAHNSLRVIVGAAKIVSILHFVMFLYNGEYPSVLYRISNSATTQTRDGPSHSNSQLFMESRKMLWYSFLGLATAASITVDWQAMKYYLYFQAQAVLRVISSSKYGTIARRYIDRMKAMLFSSRRRSADGTQGTAEGHTSDSRETMEPHTATDSTMSGSSGFTVHREGTSGNFNNSAAGGGGGGGGGGGVGDDDDINYRTIRTNHSNKTFSSILSSSNNSRSSSHNGLSCGPDATTADTIHSNRTATAAQQSFRCTACGIDPAEMPHVSNCNHIFCYLCLQNLILAAEDSISADTYYTEYSGGGSGQPPRCPRCYDALRVCKPWAPPSQSSGIAWTAGLMR